jgi:hypothetical protein
MVIFIKCSKRESDEKAPIFIYMNSKYGYEKEIKQPHVQQEYPSIKLTIQFKYKTNKIPK